VDVVRFLGYPDGRVEATLLLRRVLSRVIRAVRPTRVLAPSPERNYRIIYASHPDHVAVGAAALAAVYPDARNPFAHPELLDEGFAPWSVGELYLMAAPETDTYVDITDAIERKIEALRNHVSQLPEPEGIDARLRAWAGANAEVGGLAPGRLAEAFLRVETG
jgi:LmbE family N-acetylglucosaminyl deacetylase